MKCRFKMLDEIPINKKDIKDKRDNIVVPRCAALNNYVIDGYVWIANNEVVVERDLFVKDYDFNFDLNKIKELNRKLMEEELDFVSH